MFKPVSAKLNVNEMEEGILKYWKEKDIFQKSTDNRAGKKEFIFFEGPPTANGKPGVHHVLSRSFKDVVLRYRTMQGCHISRRGGWDTHGLPVEIEVEKKLGFTNKQQIEDFGIDKFNKLCKESAFTNIQEWERMTERVAYWVDLSTAYVTYKDEYIESEWSILKNFFDRNLLYQGFKVVPYCPRCGTPLADHEVAQGYQEAEDPSIYFRLQLIDQPDTNLLVWTTTPWTLPANVGVAAHPDVTYVKIERTKEDGATEKLIMAETLVPVVLPGEEVKILETYKGSDLKGWRYEPLYRFLPLEKPAHRIVLADYVTTEDGTGLVHIAPSFGAEDNEVGKREDFPLLMTVDGAGKFIPEVTPWAGLFVKDADPLIIKELVSRGRMLKHGKIKHTYPFCWRCGTPLLYVARPTWYIRTSQFKDRLVELNERINWYPGHIKHGRFGNWLENNIDWALGRNRYWGTPLPIWICDDCGHQECIGSRAELSQKTGKDYSNLELHRPYVDEVTWHCKQCGGTMRRVPELIDVWFDSGAMPYAQWGYPIKNEKEFKEQYPADYICEAIDQTRGWFYSLHAVSTLLMNQECFKNVICLGLVLDEKGHKMSKHIGNVVSPWDVIKDNGADAMRWYLFTSSPAGQERRFSSNLVNEVLRSFTLQLWNTYSFFVMYANLDGWTPNKEQKIEYSDLDRWLLSALNALVRNITKAYEEYDVNAATRPIQAFVDQLSNWYLRRSRRRFWKSEGDGDKNAAYQVLYTALVTVAKLIAPAMPFLADELYQNLVCSVDPDAVESVHMADWPVYDESLIDEQLNHEMNLVVDLASLGHAARNKENLKVRQPLAECAFSVGLAEDRPIIEKYADILEEELNVKKVRLLDAASEAMDFTLNPQPKQLGQKYGKLFPVLRKAILALEPMEAGKALLEGKSVTVTVDGENYEILPEEVEVRANAHTGFVVATSGSSIAALETTLTPELVKEGLAREFVRRIQDLRKTAGLEISDRIAVIYEASPLLAEAIHDNAEYIQAETLAVSLQAGNVPAEWDCVEDQFDQQTVKAGLQKH
ncbi:isoleucine--tRNA ligase [Flexilinea flocculi]|uniref:Isoleucine--tRNA ligase n=1 Tax=Flexilinea flocculi TaxID=1678840 RepID=A0A0S7BR66_9CHLR|nr:isoleucine--tRNA ligase [Flexilinea flocculi]GAP40142.1 isoleucyl-tRNA synthetase [Flexilinea flocculi]